MVSNDPMFRVPVPANRIGRKSAIFRWNPTESRQIGGMSGRGEEAEQWEKKKHSFSRLINNICG